MLGAVESSNSSIAHIQEKTCSYDTAAPQVSDVGTGYIIGV